MTGPRRGVGRLARLVYAYTALCMGAAIGTFLAVATWHFLTQPPPDGGSAERELRPPPPGRVAPPPRGNVAERPPPLRRRPPPPGVTPPPDVLLIVGLTLVVLVSILSYFFARRITVPLRKLEDAALSFGNGDHSARVGNQQKDEVGAASRAFDDMAARTAGLIASQKELMANVSHELRTPLTRMRVALDVAETRQQAMPDLLASLRSDVSELQSITGEVLDGLRVAMTEELGELPLVDLTERLQELVRSLREWHGDERILLELDPQVRCRAKPEILGRAFANLIDNALKYSEGPVVIQLRDAADHVQFEVTDTGGGISQEDLAKIFTPFFRGDRSRHRATGGVGLGLSLVKRIIDAHRGTVSVESEVGRGTVVRVVLPKS